MNSAVQSTSRKVNDKLTRQAPNNYPEAQLRCFVVGTDVTTPNIVNYRLQAIFQIWLCPFNWTIINAVVFHFFQ